MMLDLDHGTYPFVIDQQAVGGGVASPGRTPAARPMIGVVKAYTTRVGSGPFPSELFNADGEKLGRSAASSASRPAGTVAAAGTSGVARYAPASTDSRSSS